MWNQDLFLLTESLVKFFTYTAFLEPSLSRFISMVTSQYRKTEPKLWGNGEKWRCGVRRRGEGAGDKVSWDIGLCQRGGFMLSKFGYWCDVRVAPAPADWPPLLAPALARLLRWYWSRDLSLLSSPCRRHVLPQHYGHEIYLAAKNVLFKLPFLF